MENSFYGVMLICPIGRQPYEVMSHWRYISKYDCWHGNGCSYPAEICKREEGVDHEK